MPNLRRFFPTFLGLLLLATPRAVPGDEPAPAFVAAHPVWAAGRATEKNLTLGFHAAFSRPTQGRTTLRITGSTLYRAYLNGRFAGHGPARAGHGSYRVDEWDLTPALVTGTNHLAIEVAGYNVNSYYLLDQPSFLQAEIVADGRVLAATVAAADGGPTPATTGFSARVVEERVQKVQRYSFQRPFSEIWRLSPSWNAWRTGGSASTTTAALARQPDVPLLPRRVALPEFALRQPERTLGIGRMQAGAAPDRPWRDRALTDIGAKLGGYPEKELASIPSLEFQAWTNVPTAARTESRPWSDRQPIRLRSGESETVDFGVNLTGFLGVEVVASRASRVFLTFDEILRDGDVDWKRLGCVNIVALELQPGRYAFESFEPYTLRYAKIVVLEGDLTLEQASLRELACPDVQRAGFAASDPRLNRLFEAGRETFRQNAVDIFMDCPSRERAGWLCDSFFTARVAPWLTGDTRIERNFLENFRVAPRFAHLPDGVLPMCYPADHPDGIFIPNWTMWFVVELEEYAARSGDRELVEALRPRVLDLLAYLATLRNEEGLLEKLPSWVFLEWSKANEWVQDVNFPSNMLYAQVLEAAARLYQLPELATQADRLRDVIRRLSFDGAFFVDNAIRRDGRLQVTRNRSEVAQYFAFFFHVASPESHPELWRVLRDEFGPRRKTTGAHPEIAPANAFVGNVLRLEILSRQGRTRQLLEESVGYLLYMAEKTGTLWENDGDYASCNHGFASHIVNVLYRDVLGLRRVDPVNRRIRIAPGGPNLDWCEGSVFVPEGRVHLRWWRDNGTVRHHCEAPAGYRVVVDVPAPEPAAAR